MKEPPRGVSQQEILHCVRQQWLTEANRISHLPLGFGAHHWAVGIDDQRQLFVTLDLLGTRHSIQSLENAYASAAWLAQAGLDFVAASLPSMAGTFTVPFGPGRLSTVPWLADGRSAPQSWDLDHAKTVTQILDRLHASPSPPTLGRWQPRVRADFADWLRGYVDHPWLLGPYGEQARTAISNALPQVVRWTQRYHDLIMDSQRRRWVPTHGEAHWANQVCTERGIVLVDWESLALAPRERDTRAVVAAGYPELVDPDWPMIEMFDLEWRLDEISEYARWFAAEHLGSSDDEIAFGGLIDELERPDWQRPD